MEEKLGIEVPGGCGPRALQLIYAKFGIRTNQFVLANEMGTTAQEGTPIEEIKRNINRHDLKYLEFTQSSWELLKDLSKAVERPIIVNWTDEDEEGHFSVVHRVTDQFVYLLGEGGLTRGQFVSRWHDSAKGKEYNHWMLCVYRPERIKM